MTKTTPATNAARRSRKPRADTTSAARSATKGGAEPTTILLVRHGQTPTTGKVLPGRAKGLHLANHLFNMDPSLREAFDPALQRNAVLGDGCNLAFGAGEPVND